MRILPKVLVFQWDEGIIRKNIEKHSVMPVEAEESFVDDRFFFSEDKEHSMINEQRYNGLGQTKTNRQLFVAFTVRGEKIRVISVRDMNKNERKAYEQTENNT